MSSYETVDRWGELMTEEWILRQNHIEIEERLEEEEKYYEPEEHEDEQV